jgi:signal transduction histidine kinase
MKDMSRSIVDMMKQDAVQTVVHDLRAPMTVIKGYLHLLLSGSMGEMSAEHKELIRRSVGPLDEMILMTENLLQAASLDRADQMRFEKADLDLMLAETVEFYQLPFKQRDMHIYRAGNTLGVTLSVDSFWVKRVLHNLIWNAFKFTPDGGKVVLHVERTPKGLDVSSQDTGRGIPPEQLLTIFEKFAQADAGRDRRLGTGLGLWICRRVMELHDGAIRVESHPGHGSRFILSLPATRIL